jgi:hypothetical protein
LTTSALALSAAAASQANAQDQTGAAGAEAGDIIVTARASRNGCRTCRSRSAVCHEQQISNRNIVIASDLAIGKRR